jgi:hypothetical protein
MFRSHTDNWTVFLVVGEVLFELVARVRRQHPVEREDACEERAWNISETFPKASTDA